MTNETYVGIYWVLICIIGNFITYGDKSIHFEKITLQGIINLVWCIIAPVVFMGVGVIMALVVHWII